MHSTLLKSMTAALPLLLLSSSGSTAATFSDPHLGFSLTLQSECNPRPDMVGATPDVVHAVQFGETAEGEFPVILVVEKMGGVLSRDRRTMQSMPPGFKGSLFVTRWQGFELDAVEIPETVNGIDILTYNVQIPLKPEAIQIKLFGPAVRKDLLRSLVEEVLAGLEGKTNWEASMPSPAAAERQGNDTVLLVLTIAGIVAGVVFFWFLSRWTPKGTVLAIGVILYVASWQIDDSRIREIRLLVGIMRMLGTAATILGIVDLCRKRQPAKGIEPGVGADSR